jgi:hypothetical protein
VQTIDQVRYGPKPEVPAATQSHRRRAGEKEDDTAIPRLIRAGIESDGSSELSEAFGVGG